MLQGLLIAPYIALAASLVLALTVAVICATQAPQQLEVEGFGVRAKKPKARTYSRPSRTQVLQRAAA
jgi:hypothetical protein